MLFTNQVPASGNPLQPEGTRTIKQFAPFSSESATVKTKTSMTAKLRTFRSKKREQTAEFLSLLRIKDPLVSIEKLWSS
jgi:hypothetical protein